jgi:signal transduction histidine kinase
MKAVFEGLRRSEGHSRASQLRWRLVAAFLFVSVVPVLASSFIAAQWITSQFDNRLELWLQDSAKFFVKSINADQEEVKRAVDLLAASLTDKVDVVDKATFALTADLLNSVGYDFVAVYDESGNTLYRFGKFDGVDWLPKRDVATLFPTTAGGVPTLVMGAARKFMSGGRPYYIFVGDETSDEAVEIGGADTSLRIQILSVESGHVAQRPEDEKTMPRAKLLRRVVANFSKGAEIDVEPEPGGKDVAIGFAALRDIDGRLVGMVMSRLAENLEYPAPIRLIPMFVVLSALSGLLSLLVALALSARIARPIRALTAGVRDIAGGDYQARVREEGGQELEELAGGFNAMAANLHRLHELETEMRRKGQFAVLGEAAAAIAHEIRNPLGIIKTSSEVIRMKKPLAEGSDRLIGFILEEVDRIDGNMQDLLDYVRPTELAREPTDLYRDVVLHVLQFVAPELEKRGQTAAIREPGAPMPILGDRRSLHGVLLNIVLNAMDATPSGGQLTVTARNDGDLATVTIEDTGCGIPEAIIDRIFEPFVTTKPKGNGLGLAKVRSVVEQHGGEVTCASVESEGATFTLSIPLRRDA